jgi:Zn-dependent protease
LEPSLGYIVSLFVILIASLSVHEAAHAWMANRLGDPTARMLGRLTLNPLAHIDWIGTVLFPLIAIFSGFPLIGWAKPVPVNGAMLQSPRRDFAFVAVAGPVSNVLLALLGAAVFVPLIGAYRADLAWASPVMVEMVFRFVYLNVFLAAFNMLPVPPLDGGNVLMGLVPESVARVIDQIRPWGIFVLYALMFMGVIGAIARPIELFLVRWLLT